MTKRMIIAMNVLDMVTIITTTKNWMITSVPVMIVLITTTTGKMVGGEMMYREAVWEMTAKRMPGNWFNVNNGAYCGIVMPEHVMKKLAKLYAKHNDEVKDLLTQHKDEIYPYEWTLAYPNGEQKKVAFNSAYWSIEERIEKYDENTKINRLKDFYVSDANTFSERKDEVIQLYMEKHDIEEEGEQE